MIFGARSRDTFTTLVLLCLSTGLAVVSCKEQSAKERQPGAAEETSSLPPVPFTVSKNTKGVLFTFVDENGGFQITDKAESVPQGSRKTVRVVVEGHPPGSEEFVFLADATDAESGKNLPVRAAPRAEWEKLGSAQREKRLSALAPEKKSADPSPADLGVDAIVYGADWCKPCHLAEDYLKKVGARVVKKDIEEDPSAASEMRRKLQQAGMSGSSIPVLDVGGTILKGFSQSAVDAALSRAQKKP